MTNLELQELLKQYPDDAKIYLIEKDYLEINHWKPIVVYQEEFNSIEIKGGK